MHARSVPPAALGLSGRRDLHLAGSLPPPPRLAVVGSRAAHRHLRDAVEPLVHAAGRRGWSIVSGGAVGVDADAHAAALQAGIPQLAILPCGPDRAYPPQHAPLLEHIVQSGSGVLYAHPPGTEPTRGMFASRNAIVVALADAVVVVEAAPRSGTMLTATLARRRGRPRAAVSGSTGAAVLQAEGAHALPWDPEQPAALMRAVDGWLRGIERGEVPAPAPSRVAWPEHLQWLRDAIDAAGPTGLRVEALPSPRAALVALTEAEARGLVVEPSPGRFLRAG